MQQALQYDPVFAQTEIKRQRKLKKQILRTGNISSIHVCQFVQALIGGLGEEDFSFG